MKKFVVAIPTYNRYKILRDNTLKLLKQYNFNTKELVYIFVANEDEATRYKEILDENDYNQLIVGEIGMKNIRNFICNYFDLDQNIFFMDDDLSQVMVGYKDNNLEFTNFEQIIYNGFKECKQQKLNLFGFYPVYNKYFMKNKISYDLKYIIGSCYGLINKKILVGTDDKEDVERTLQYYVRDGGVIRYNYISFKTNYYTNKGGMQKNRTLKTIREGAEYITQEYPELAEIVEKKNGRYEIKLNYKDTLYKKELIKPIIISIPIENNKDNKEIYFNLLDKLNKITIPIIEGPTRFTKTVSKIKNVYTRGSLLGYKNKGRTMTLGYSRRRSFGYGLTSMTKKHMDLFYLLIEYGLKILPRDFIFTSITVNYNLKCLPHKDNGNFGFSCITALGEFENGNLFIEGEKYDIKNNLVMFDGSKCLHQTENFSGDRYTIIYYKQNLDYIAKEYIFQVK
jgi:hypothetical protein